MAIATVGVVGAGTMGAGIAQVAAAKGHAVVLRDLTDELVRKGMAAIEKGLARLVEKGKIPAAEREAALGRIRPTTNMQDLAVCDVVVEAVFEDPDVKKEVLRHLDASCPAATILASNTSSISITDLAAATKRPDRVVGMHFFNPVPVMALVEVVRGQETSDTTAAAVVQLAKDLGKTPVEVHDFPGFVSNRLLMPYINEAFHALAEGVARPEDIDTVAKLGFNHPMGPLELADLIGLDVCLDILEVLRRDLGDPKYAPSPLLRQLVRAGRLGRKSGRGVYAYG